MKLHHVLSILILLLGATTSAFAKGGGSAAIQSFLMGSPVNAIVLARFDDGQKNLVVEKTYQGKLRSGDQINLLDEQKGEFDISSKEPDRNSSQKFLLFLVQKNDDQRLRNLIRVGDHWMADTSASRRIVDGKVYDWALGIPRGVVKFPKPGSTEKTDGLYADSSTGTLDKAEMLIQYGNWLHEQWTEASATTNSEKKLELLKPFLLPTDDGMLTPYMVWRVTPQALDEADKAGAASIPFYKGLLTEPAFQSDFAPDQWIGFGAEHRLRVEQRLCMQQARLESDPTKKLAQLAPLFTLHDFDFRAGCDGNCLLTEIMDKALAELEKCGEVAIPFLREVLGRPYFQASERLESGRLNSGGRERREKAEATLAKLQIHG